MAKKNSKTEESSITVENTETPGTQLNIQDIVSLLNFVEVASRRGAYQAKEMSTVGGTWDRVFAFLKSTGAITEPAAEEEKE